MSNFTDTYIKALKPTDKRFKEYEGGGFGIRVSPTSVKTWIYRYKINGKTDKITLGHYPNMSLANAKKRFIELSEQRKEGLTPKTVIRQQAQKENNTVKKLILDWYSGYAEKHRKKPLQIKQQIDANIIPSLGNFALEKIQTIDIVTALDKIVSRDARIHANRVLSTIKQAFNYGVSRGNLTHNPAGTIRSRDIGGIEKPRERVLSLNEIKKIWLFLDTDECQMSPQTKIAIKIILLTGVRTSELRLATWKEFDFDNSLWTVPAENSKGGLIHKIHLSAQVKELLIELKQTSNSRFVICGTDNNKTLSEHALARAIARIQKRVGIPRWTAHDGRRSFATHLGETLRVDPVVIEKCLGHKMPRIMATYNKNEMMPKRKDALNQWARLIGNLVENSNVIALEQAV
ncbi:MAG: integrase [Gammaproteobacteria bacterium RIFCSPHIGHO2_12_FULL_38_11]|nr:MAG: integrase [Gammaproteobacteria bacterium RIFCSPHIGHO2_12_FULL_38_11]